MIIAIDPGTTQSALVVWDEDRKRIHTSAIVANESLRGWLRETAKGNCLHPCYIEMIASYGMSVGKEVFETCVWIGRFAEAMESRSQPVTFIYRRDIKLHHCGSARAKDSNIRTALIDKYGAPGTKKQQGVTYGLKQDLWAAFALAAFVIETKGEQKHE